MIINKANGFIKLHKKILNSSLSQDNNAFRVFIALLLMAFHKDNSGSVRLNGKQLAINRGQLVISRNELADFLNMSPSTVRNVLSRLQVDKRVDIKTDNKKSLITICKYSEYQDTEDRLLDNKRTTRGQHQSVSEERRIKNNIHVKIFDFYQRTFNQNLKLTDARKRLIQKRLSEFTEEQIYQAITNASHEDFYNGINTRGWKGTVDYLFRSTEIMEKYVQLSSKPMSKSDQILEARKHEVTV